MTQRTKLGAIIVLVAGVVLGLSVLLLNNPITNPANWCASGKDTDCWIITEGYQVRRVRKLCTERHPTDCWYDANQAKREAAPNDAALKAPNWAFRSGKEGETPQ
jgi:hypothetical protein